MSNSRVKGETKVIAESNNADPERVWGRGGSRSDLFVRNLSATYIAKGVEIAVGLLMLPFNVSYLGQSTYGLWMIAASIPAYFSILDLGYGVAQVRFISKYRAFRDAVGLNETVSTLVVVFGSLGLSVFIAGAVLAYNISILFDLSADEASTAQQVLLIISFYVSVGFPFSVFGAVVNGFQRQHMNAYAAIATSIVVALVNVSVLLSGFGLVALVAATTSVRLLFYVIYRANAYRAFPGLSIRMGYIKFKRLREVTGFSSYIFLIDLANKLNYSTDVPVIGALIGPTAVAIWAVAQRLITATQDMTTQVSGALFPVVADMSALEETDRLREVFLLGTRLSFALVIPSAIILSFLADSLVLLWVGPNFAGSVPVIWILAAAVIIRVGNSTATTTLKGAGEHSFLTKANIGMAIANLTLSIVLARSMGLIGVAIGTLIPLLIVSIFLIFPRACRRVEISQFTAYRCGIWPSIWPVIPSAVAVSITSRFLEPGWPSLGIQAVGAGGVYSIVFLWLAIGRAERDWYFSKIKRLARWRRVSAA